VSDGARPQVSCRRAYGNSPRPVRVRPRAVRARDPGRPGLRWAGRTLVGALMLPLLHGACSANGDFGRLKPELYGDALHDWVGRDVARTAKRPISTDPLTDEEHLLRDLAYPSSRPPTSAISGTRSSANTASLMLERDRQGTRAACSISTTSARKAWPISRRRKRKSDIETFTRRARGQRRPSRHPMVGYCRWSRDP